MIKFILAIVGFLGIIASAKYPKKSNELGDNFNIGGRLFRQSYLKWGLMLIAFALFPFFNSIIYDNSSSSNSGSESHSNITKVTFSEAEAFMQNRCNATNQTLMKKKSVNFNGTKLFMFLSVAENGYVCISSVSENALEVLAADCGPSEIKIEEWNAVN